MLDFVPFFWVSLSNFVEESSKEKCIEMCLFYFILCPLDIVQFTLGYPQKCNSIICPLESSLKQQGSMSYRHCISFTWSSLLREVFLRQDQEKPWHIYCPASALLASGISCHFFDTMKTQSNLNVPKHETWILKTLEYINLNMSWKLMDFIFCARLCVFALKSCEFLSQALCKKQNLPSQNCGLIRFCVPSNSQISSTKQITRTETPIPQVACCGPRARYSNGHWCWSWDPPGSVLLSGKCGESVSGRRATPWKPNHPLIFRSLWTFLRS